MIWYISVFFLIIITLTKHSLCLSHVLHLTIFHWTVFLWLLEWLLYPLALDLLELLLLLHISIINIECRLLLSSGISELICDGVLISKCILLAKTLFQSVRVRVNNYGVLTEKLLGILGCLLNLLLERLESCRKNVVTLTSRSIILRNLVLLCLIGNIILKLSNRLKSTCMPPKYHIVSRRINRDIRPLSIFMCSNQII